MFNQIVYESEICFASLAHVRKTAPARFMPCYRWFMDNEGVHIAALPHRMRPAIQAQGIPLSRDAGIYSPSADRVAYGKRRYALSVHSGGRSHYDDGSPITLENGTWIVDYKAHVQADGEAKGQDYNDWLLNCLFDALPVGVMIKGANGGYDVLGLAFVERFNSESQVFTLHGPVNAQTDAEGLFNLIGTEDLSPHDLKQIEEWDLDDERERTLVSQIRRKRQSQFRNLLLDAYGGRCAVTQTNTPTVLQAAHIDPYRGSKSQVVCNGILLRADLHLLFDAHLVSVDPDSMRLHMGKAMEGSSYVELNMRRLMIPSDASLQPSIDLLGKHYEQFLKEDKLARA
jgi:hypothetical protein